MPVVLYVIYEQLGLFHLEMWLSCYHNFQWEGCVAPVRMGEVRYSASPAEKKIEIIILNPKVPRSTPK